MWHPRWAIFGLRLTSIFSWTAHSVIPAIVVLTDDHHWQTWLIKSCLSSWWSAGNSYMTEVSGSRWVTDSRSETVSKRCTNHHVLISPPVKCIILALVRGVEEWGGDKSRGTANRGRESRLPVDLYTPRRLLGACWCSCDQLEGSAEGNFRGSRCEQPQRALHTVISEKINVVVFNTCATS